MNTQYISVANTAKLLRQALKESFPGVKFSVRSSSYAGGASINVGWQDGPAGKLVDEIAGQFQGAYFDGMIDYKGSRYHSLDGAPVHFGANFIFTNRQKSFPLAEKIAAILAGKGWEVEIRGSAEWGFSVDGKNEYSYHIPPYEIDEAAAIVSADIQAQPSATLARIGFLGDDGYGQGTSGLPGGPGGPGGDQCAKAVSAHQEMAAMLVKVHSGAAVIQ